MFKTILFDLIWSDVDITSFFDLSDDAENILGSIFSLREGERIVELEETYTLVGGRFQDFVPAAKYHHQVVVPGLDSDLHLATISGLVSDKWSFAVLQYGRYEYEHIFRFKSASDALLFKMKL